MTPLATWQSIVHWAGQLMVLGGAAWSLYARYSTGI